MMLDIPLISLEGRDPDSVLELEGSRFDVNCVNWPASWPYAPFCSGRIARTRTELVIGFRTSGLDLRALNLEDNLRQWEDSCVEFFVQDPSRADYYNFEINPLGKILACKGPAREGRVHRSAEEMESIRRFAFLEGPQDLSGGIHSWRVTVLIPLRLMGIDPERLPAGIRANFYKCGDKTAHPHFLSWNPVGTPAPDFHRPEFFGELRFV